MQKIVNVTLLIVATVIASSTAVAQLLPPDRDTTWNPGIAGGIPSRSIVCATVNSSTYGDGASDATSGIQAAIDACPAGQVVQLSAGTFRISSTPLRILKGITLRGAGPKNTTLQKPDGSGQPVIVVGERYASYVAPTNLTANAVKGTSSVAVASTAGLQVGQIVLIDKLADPALSFYSADCGTTCQGWFSRTGRPITQMMEIQSISGNTVTFTTPFHITFDTAYAAQLTSFSAPAVKYAGVEDLKAAGGEGGDDGGNFLINLAAYSWLKNVESYYSSGASVHLYRSFRCVIRDSYFHETKNPNPGGAGYGIDISHGSSDSLVENNISWWFNKTILMRAAGGGNVIGYNYFEDGFGMSYKTYVEFGLNASHFATPHHVLFEGNQAWNFGADMRWGNSIYITFFRNHATTLRRDIKNIGLVDAQNRVGVTIYARHYWYTFIGNVLGYAGMNPNPGGTYFEYEDLPPLWDTSSVPMWRFGLPDSAGTPGITGVDPQVKATAIRDGNFDYFSNVVHWDREVQPIPPSLYLTNKPAFFGSCAWPWVDPTGPVKINVLPARARFDGNPNACSNVALPAPTNLRVTN